MRDINRFERFILLLALYMWQWYEAMIDFVETVEENRRGLRRGAADIDWQRTLHALAAPVRQQRLTGEQPKVVEPFALPAAPSLADLTALPVVGGDGTVFETFPRPTGHIRKHRTFEHPVKVQAHTRRRPKARVKAALMASGAPEVRAAEADVLGQLEAVVAEAMARLVGDEEAAHILGLWSYAG